MGSPGDEELRDDDEGPQHNVNLDSFWMGKHPVTQAQWKAVAALPKIERDLKTDPARFKGDNRPIETVTWDDAIEFCKRLSKHTKRDYRLPSEAEWEYACRAGTTTPFYFGPTISPGLVNYNGSYTYGQGPKGEYREQTTDVGSFPPNAFGLYDMHGNVYEWCADHWHNNYQSAPANGDAWVSGGDSSKRVLRGGSWAYVPWYCRSANRHGYARGNLSYRVGFRVVCASSWALE